MAPLDTKERVSVAPSPDQKKRRVARLLSRAAGHLARGNHRYAARALYQAMDEDPHNPEIRRRLAQVLLESCEDWMVGGALGWEWTEQRLSAVIEPLRPLLRSGDDAESFKLLGKIYARFRRYEHAAEALRKAIHAGADADPEVHELLGRISLWIGNRERAGSCFHRALALSSRYSPAMVGLALVEVQNGDYGQAIGRLRKAVEVDPACTEAYCRLAEIYLYHLGDLRKASLLARQALLSDPHDPMARHTLGMALYLSGDVAGAVREWQKTVSGLNAYSPSLHTLANVALEQEDYHAARGYLERLLFANPDDAEAKVKLGLANAALGDYSNASRLWEEARRQNRQDGYSRVFLADLYASLGRWQEAWAALEEVLTLDLPPDLDEQLRDLLLEGYAHCSTYELAARTVDLTVKRYPRDPAILLAAALVHTGGKNFTVAWEYAERARRLQPADPGVYRVLGVWHMERGDLEQAQQVLERGFALNRNDPRTAFHMGEVCARRHHWEEALRWWEEAHRLDPEDPGYVRRLAWGYQRTGNLARAREAWEQYLTAAPEDVSGQLSYGQVCFLQGDVETCLAVCQRLLPQERRHPWRLLLLGACAARSGDPRQGLRWLKAAWQKERDTFLSVWPSLTLTREERSLLRQALRRGRYDPLFKADISRLLNEET